MNKNLHHKIINYWNDAGLCSLESPTSHAHPDLAYLDNSIEVEILYRLLCQWPHEKLRCLDIGAGLGRFTHLFARVYKEILLLEPARDIFSKLTDVVSRYDNVICLCYDFESFTDESNFNLIFTSGLLYLYDESMVSEYFEKVLTLLNRGGVLIIRDFISTPEYVKTESKFIRGGFCYYRPPHFYQNLSQRYDLEYMGISRSKPQLKLLRKRRVLRVLTMLGFSRFLRNESIKNVILRYADFKICDSGIQSVYIGMSKK